MKKIRINLFLLSMCILLCTSSSVHATQYQMVDIGSTISGGTSYAHAINNSGQIVGYGNQGGQEHAFLQKVSPIKRLLSREKDTP